MSDYQAPVLPAGSYPAPTRPTYSLTGLAVAIQILLALQAVTAVLLVVASLDQRSLLNRLEVAPDSVTLREATDSDGYVGALNLATSALYLATGIVWIVWLFRARRNTTSWGAPFQRFGVGWTIGAWFIPLANLVLPAMVTRDVADGTDAEPDDISGRRWPQPVVACWGLAWAVLLVTSVVDTAQNRGLDDYGTTFDDIRSALTWDVVSEAATLVAVVAAVVLVRRLTRRQHERLATSPAA